MLCNVIQYFNFLEELPRSGIIFYSILSILLQEVVRYTKQSE